MDAEGLAAWAKAMFKDNEAMIKMTAEVATVCVAVTDPDRCEMAFKEMKCTHDEINKRGMTFAEYML